MVWDILLHIVKGDFIIFPLSGALSLAELGTLIPLSGGEYIYLLQGIGGIPAFLFSWTCMMLLRPASVAIISLTCAEYILRAVMSDCASNMLMLKRLMASLVICTFIGVLMLFKKNLLYP